MNRHTPGLNAIAARYPTPCTVGLDGGSHVRQRARDAMSYDTPTVHGDGDGGSGRKGNMAKFQTIGCRNMGGASGSFHKLRALADAGEITEEERRNMASGAQLNPDWVEWLMGWPVGWTDITRDECDWRDLSTEPSDIHIATTRRDNRPARIKAIGNGQVPLCAAVAAESGFAFLEAVHELQAASAATARGGLPATPGAGLSALADGFDRAGGHFPSRTVTE